MVKGIITIGELENLPNRYINVIYKEYFETMKNKDKQEALAGAEMEEQLEEAALQGGL